MRVNDEPAACHPIDRLLTAWRKGKVDLVTSELTLAEIKRYQDTRMRAAIERIFRLLEKVEIVRWDELVGMHSYGDARTWLVLPLINNYPEYGALLTLGLEVIDAQHVYRQERFWDLLSRKCRRRIGRKRSDR
jgi:hypothetical protein